MAIRAGIEIDQNTIKIALFEGSFGRYVFQEFHELDINGEEEVVPALKEFFFPYIKQKPSCIINLPVSKVSTRIVELPFSDPTKISEILPYQIEDQIPFEIDEVSLCHRIIPLQQDAEESKILVALTQLNYLSSHLQALEDIGLDVQKIVLCSDILSYFSTNEPSVILHFQENTINCSLSYNRQCIDLKKISIPSSLIGLIDKKNTSIVQPEYEGFNDVQRLMMQIQKQCVHFEDHFELEIDNVFVSGSLNKHFKDSLAEQLGMDILDIVPPIQEEISDIIKFGPCYAMGKEAVGESNITPLDFRQGSLSYGGNFTQIMQIMKIIAALYLFAILSGLSWFGYEYYELQQQQSELEAKIMDEVEFLVSEEVFELLDDPRSALDIVLEETTELQNKEQKLREIRSTTPPILDLLKEISLGMPPHKDARIDINNLTISKASINIKAETDGFNQASIIEQSLKKRPAFKRAVKSDGKIIRDINQFTIQIPLGEPENKEDD